MQIIRDKWALHRIPELGWNLPKTLHYLKTSLGSRAFSPMPGALGAYYDFGASRTLAFRADMDALPGGHLCGHDGHMAILLELARRLARKRRNPNNVLLIFQPAEETTGGAKALCETGIFEEYRVAAMFGLHIWPGLPQGRLFTKPGAMMARACQIDAEILGEPGHIAAPGADAVGAAATFVAQNLWESGAGLLKFGLFQGGTAGNVRPPAVRLQGSLRCFSDAEFAARREKLLRSAEASDCRILCKLSEGYPQVDNPPWLVRQACRAAEFEILSAPSLLSEDFSWYQRHLPGLFFFLGAGEGPDLHSPDFDFPEDILGRGADFWEALATSF